MSQHDERDNPAATDDRLHPSLPVTAEVGSEGGSYADPTHQVASFENNLPRTRGRGGASSAATQAIRTEDVAGGSDPNHGMLRYPTDPPDAPTAQEARRMTGPNWRAGAIGAAAGAIAVVGLEFLRRRSR
jgi:hypothetical protein